MLLYDRAKTVLSYLDAVNSRQKPGMGELVIVGWCTGFPLIIHNSMFAPSGLLITMRVNYSRQRSRQQAQSR